MRRRPVAMTPHVVRYLDLPGISYCRLAHSTAKRVTLNTIGTGAWPQARLAAFNENFCALYTQGA